MDLGNNIYEYRTKKGWSQSELAEELGVSRQSVSKWENNSAVPDLDKLIKMKTLFEVSIDEIVFGGKEEAAPQLEPTSQKRVRSVRTVSGMVMLVFGMTFFLLSIFWGDHLYFGEAFGELMSAVIVLISIAMIVPYDFRVLTVCSIIYFLYSVISFGILNIANTFNSLFTFIASIVIVVWFIACGLHANKEDTPKA